MIPVAQPNLGDLERRYVLDAVDSGWLSQGPYIQRAEELLQEIYGVGRALVCANGTVALDLALAAIGVRTGDDVLCPDLTYIATVNAVRHLGATPILIDVDRYWQLDVARVEEAITPNTRAILVTDLYGGSANLLELRKLADRHGLFLLEDAAEAHVTECLGMPIGTFSDIATLSFYGNKCVVASEGGAVLTSSNHLAERMNMLRGQGQSSRFVHPTIGHNWRLSNLSCAVLTAQLERMDELIGDRRQVYGRYDQALASVPGVSLQPCPEHAQLTPWLYSVLINEREFGHTRDELMEHLLGQGIETREFFKPVHHQVPHMPAEYRNATESERRKYDMDHFPVSTRLAQMGLNLPTHHGVTESVVAQIADEIKTFLCRNSTEDR